MTRVGRRLAAVIEVSIENIAVKRELVNGHAVQPRDEVNCMLYYLSRARLSSSALSNWEGGIRFAAPRPSGWCGECPVATF
jgi:hypothetical protein